MVYSGLLKKKKKILCVQTIQLGLLVISNIILGGVVGAIINVINSIRNILYYKKKLGLKEKITITIISVVLSLRFNNIWLIGLLPMISSVIYLWLMDINDIIKFKIMIVITTLFWFIYELTIKSYTSAIFDFLTVIANIYSIIILSKKRYSNE